MSVPTISARDFAARFSAGKPVHLIDVRTPAEFAAVHVRGARSIPLDNLDPAEIAREFPRAEPLYVICQAGSRSAKACAHLLKAGMTNVLSVDGGTTACQRVGLPVEQAPTPPTTLSLERQVRIAAGALILLGTLLAWKVSPWFLALPAFVGAGLVFAGLTNSCGLALLLTRCPWNQRQPANS